MAFYGQRPGMFRRFRRPPTGVPPMHPADVLLEESVTTTQPEAGNGSHTAEMRETDYGRPAVVTEPPPAVATEAPPVIATEPPHGVHAANGSEPPPTRPRVAGPLEAFLRYPFLTLLPMLLLL